MDSKQQANNLLYLEYKEDTFSRTQRKCPVWIRRNHKPFFFFLLPEKSRFKRPELLTFFLLLFNS